MKVTFATEAAPGRPANEDAVVVSGSLVGVLDGVTAPVDIDTGCIHGPAWYVERLATRLHEISDAAPSAALSALLARAISQVRTDHNGHCDLTNSATPAATVCLLRENGKQLDYLILSDCTLAVDKGTEVAIFTDHRFSDTIAALRRESSDSSEAVGQWRRPVTRKYELTNQPNGYWIAAADPAAAYQAVTGQLELQGSDRVRRAALLTDGASAAVDQYGLMDWRSLLDVLTAGGPAELIEHVRQAETADPSGTAHPRYKRHDDATAILCTFEEPV